MKKAIENQISELEEMKLPELQARFAEVVGEETKAPNKKYLIKRIVEVLEQGDFQDDGQAEMEIEAEAVEKPNQPDELIEADDDSSEEKTSLTKLDVDTLRDRYNEIVGRPTGSTDKRDCRTNGISRNTLSALILASSIASFSPFTGARSTADQSPSVAVGSGKNSRATRATPTTCFSLPL